MRFSIIVVALNPGEKLNRTISSVLEQTCEDYEIVVKDGGSTDGSVGKMPGDGRIRLFTGNDKGIYDAMNQAVAKARGEYLLFLNCGDLFYDRRVLERAAACIEKEKGEAPLVVYGDTYGAKNNVMLTSPGKIDGFVCYRNIPCHQSCFYAAELCRRKPYDPAYRIRADYDHFLWCYYQAGAKMVHMGSVVASYEGGGFSESRENRERDRQEHRQITEKYMTPEELAGYRRRMLLTLAPVRRFLAGNRLTCGTYHWLKDCLCHHRPRMAMGLIFLVLELFLFFGSGIMLEECVNYHTGEGSWEEVQSAEADSFTQSFQPEHRKLSSMSFLMSMENVTVQDGSVTVLISDEDNTILYERTLGFSEIGDGYFTDLEVNLELSPRSMYYFTLLTTPSSAGEYPTVGVCGKEYYLPENQTLVHEDEMSEVQLVSRYQYRNVLPASKVRNILIICLFTAFGVMFGLPDSKWLRRAAGIAILVAAPYVLGSRLEMLTYKEMFYLPISLKWNVGLMYALELLVLLCTHSPRVTIALSNIALTLLYSANYFVIMYRGTPLHMNDFTAVGTATKVMGAYSYVPNDHLAFAWGLLVLFVVFGVQTGTKRTRRRMHRAQNEGRGRRIKRLVSYAVSIAVAVAAAWYGGYQLLYTDFLSRVGFADEELKGVSQQLIYSFDGYLVATCIDLKNARITPPEDYSASYVKELLMESSGESPAASAEELPHVIVIMNESFADLRVLGDLELSQENLSFFNSLTENTVRGYVNVSVLGGGTANSEFEMITGCNMAFLPANYYPYQQGIRRPLNSLVSNMKKNGYTTISMHPEAAKNWNRASVYQYYGFDESLWEKDFEGAEVIHRGVSDAETYKKVIELYENREEGEKLFIFDLTMQNHAGYMDNEAPYEVTVQNMQEQQLDEYLSLIKISDEAFAELVRYFEQQDERVVICMFGDHQPWLSSLIAESDNTGSNRNPDQNLYQMMKKYKTPFVIWANYDIEEAEGYDISVNYLGGLLQRTAGIPLSPYFTFLENLRTEYPIITVNGYVDSEGNYYNWGSDKSEFPEYRMLQYNYLFDKDTVQWGY